MGTPVSISKEPNDKKEIYIIISVGVIIVICICCLLAVAGYFLYNDINSSPAVQPVPTSNALVETPQPPAGNPSFEDSFDSNANTWTEGTFEDEYGKTTFAIDGKYAWDVSALKGVNQKSWAEKAPTMDDFIVSVDATHTGGAENAGYGILFRIKDTDNLYFFAISDVGYYYLGSLTNGEWLTLIDWTETTYIQPSAINALKVKGIGDEITLYINDNVVDRIQDSTHSDGTAGIAIELYKAGDASAFEFDNFFLKSP